MRPRFVRLRDWLLRHRRDPEPTDSFQRELDNGTFTMGRYSYGRPIIRRFAGDTASIRVGSFTSLSEDAEFIPGGNHRTDWISTFPFRYAFQLPGSLEDGHPSSKGDIIVGNDVWIGGGARILSGVTIGDGAVIGAGAVVTRDVRPYAVMVGNPATETRRRFSDAQITALLEIAWWDWPLEEIMACVPLLSSSDVDEMINRHRGMTRPGSGVSGPSGGTA